MSVLGDKYVVCVYVISAHRIFLIKIVVFLVKCNSSAVDDVWCGGAVSPRRIVGLSQM